MHKTWRSLQETGKHDSGSHDSRSDLHNSPTTLHSVLNQRFLYTNFDFFYKTSQTVLLVLTFLDMMFEQEAVPVS